MRRIFSALTAGAVALCMGGCAASNQEAYEFGERYIGLGEYEMAGEYFRQLGEYRDATEYMLYADALLALQEGDLTLAKANFKQVASFKSAERYLQCIEAMELEAAGELEAALAIYQQLGTFAGSNRRASRLASEIPEHERAAVREMIDEGDYAAALERLRTMDKSTDTARMIAECETAIEKAAYEAACALYDEERWADALEAFGKLRDMLDVPARMAVCRSRLYLGAAETAVSQQTLPQLMQTYAQLGDYLDSAERLADLQARSERNDAVAAATYVRMGSTSDLETGEGNPVLWRVETVLDSAAQISCEIASDVTWTAHEQSILLDVAVRRASPEPLFTMRGQSGKPGADCVPVSVSEERRMLALIDLTGVPFRSGNGTVKSPFTLE